MAEEKDKDGNEIIRIGNITITSAQRGQPLHLAGSQLSMAHGQMLFNFTVANKETVELWSKSNKMLNDTCRALLEDWQKDHPKFSKANMVICEPVPDLSVISVRIGNIERMTNDEYNSLGHALQNVLANEVKGLSFQEANDTPRKIRPPDAGGHTKN